MTFVAAPLQTDPTTAQEPFQPMPSVYDTTSGLALIPTAGFDGIGSDSGTGIDYLQEQLSGQANTADNGAMHQDPMGWNALPNYDHTQDDMLTPAMTADDSQPGSWETPPIPNAEERLPGSQEYFPLIGTDEMVPLGCTCDFSGKDLCVEHGDIWSTMFTAT